MVDKILTLEEIENIFIALAYQALGFSPSDNLYKSLVRLAYQAPGAPDWKIDEDAIFIYISTPDDKYSNLKEQSYSLIPGDELNINRQISYTRVIEVKWTIYGPHSFEYAENIKNSLYKNQIKEYYSSFGLHLITDVAQPRRFPELFNGKWWQRSDLNARFNELVVISGEVPVLDNNSILLGTNIQIKKG